MYSGVATDVVDDFVACGTAYRTDVARPFMTKCLGESLAKALWVTRLAYNDSLHHLRSHYDTTKLLGYIQQRRPNSIETSKRPSRFDLISDVSRARNDTDLSDLRLLPATSLRLAASEAHDAETACIKRWAKGDRCSSPRFRSSRDVGQVRYSQFGKPKFNLAWDDNDRLRSGHVTLRLMGLAKVKCRLTRPPPSDGKLVEVQVRRGRDREVTVHLVWQYPAAERILSPLAVGEIVHHAVKHLSPIAPADAYIAAVEAAGIPVDAEDWGLSSPSTTAYGEVRERIAPTKGERSALKEARGECERLEVARRSRGRNTKQSKRHGHALSLLRRLERRQRNRRVTQAAQSAARMFKRAPVLVAVERKDVLLQLGERCSAREAKVRRLREQARALPAGVERDRLYGDAARISAIARTVRTRLREVGVAIRHAPLRRRCESVGGQFIEVEPRGTTRECAACGSVQEKSLGQRQHSCACGSVCGRDHNSGRVILGRALRSFRESADPGGRIVAREAKHVKVLADAQRAKEKRIAAGRKRAKAVQVEEDDGGVVCSQAGGESQMQNITENLPKGILK